MRKSITTFSNKLRRRIERHLANQLYSRPGPLLRIRHPDFRHTFFGYYDRSPWSPCGEYILTCSTDADSIEKDRSSAQISSYHIPSRRFESITPTRCWNYQQAAQQQWLSDGRVILNDSEGGRPVAKVFQRNRGHWTLQSTYPFHIGLIASQIGIGVSMNYIPLGVHEFDYSYPGNDLWSSQENTEHLVISVFNVNDASTLWRIDPKAILDADRDNSKSNQGFRFLQHIKLSPSGNSILFVLRSFNSKSQKKHSSLYLASQASSTLIRLISANEWDRGCNHPVWFDDEHILVNLYDESFRARKFTLISRRTGTREVILGRHDGMGHPTHVPGKNCVITDEYVRNAMQLLTLYDLKTGRRKVLGLFPPAKFPKGPNRCDLHPRVSPDAAGIAVDCFFAGRRSIELISSCSLI